MRKGSANTARGMKRFLQELRGHVTRAGWTGNVVLRCDSGFWSSTVIKFCEKHGWEYSITVRQIPSIRRLIEGIAPNGKDSCRWLIERPREGNRQHVSTSQALQRRLCPPRGPAVTAASTERNVACR